MRTDRVEDSPTDTSSIQNIFSTPRCRSAARSTMRLKGPASVGSISNVLASGMKFNTSAKWSCASCESGATSTRPCRARRGECASPASAMFSQRPSGPARCTKPVVCAAPMESHASLFLAVCPAGGDASVEVGVVPVSYTHLRAHET